MGYRDDRNALREHAETLEQELSAARAEIERLRNEAGPGAAPETPRPSGGALLGMLGLSVVVLAAMELPVPRAARLAIATVGALLIAWGLLAGLVSIALPSEALVVTGRTRKTSRGGRVIRLPILELTSLLDLGVFRVPVSIQAAETSDGRLADVEIVAHARVNGEARSLERAIEHLTGASQATRAKLVAAAVEPTFRRIIRQLDCDELHRDRQRLARALRDGAETVLEPLGVALLGVYLLETRAKGI